MNATETKTLNKVVHIGRGECGHVFCKIKIDEGRLSITGVEGPTRGGNAKGSCGQIVDSLSAVTEPAIGWDKDLILKFQAIWNDWHLNDMRAGCAHQRKLDTDEKVEVVSYNGKREMKSVGWVRPDEHPKGLLCKPCPVCGYKYGSAWLREELPAVVISFLQSLPDTDIVPAWV